MGKEYKYFYTFYENQYSKMMDSNPMMRQLRETNPQMMSNPETISKKGAHRYVDSKVKNDAICINHA
jgi:hypothetical protein